METTESLTRRTAFLPLVGSFSAGCRRAQQEGTTPVRLALTKSPITYMPAWMAQVLGCYASEGISMTIDDFPGATKTMQAVLSGSSDVGAAAYEQVIQMVTEGRHVKSFFTMLRFGTRALVVAPGSSNRIHRIEDLKGGIVGVASLGGPNHFVLNYVLAQHGMSPTDVSPVAIGTVSSAVAALERNSVQAAILNANEMFLLQSRWPQLTVLIDTSGYEGSRRVFGVDAFPTTVLFASEQWLRDNSAAARKIASAVRRTTQWLQTHSPEQIRDKMSENYRTENAEADRKALRLAIPGFSPTGAMDPEGARAVLKVLATSLPKLRAANIDLLRTYTNEFCDVSAKSGVRSH